MSEQVIPYGSRILVEPLPDELVSHGGIVIPDQAAEPPVRGRVVGVGSQYKGELKSGELVTFHSAFGSTLEYDGKEYRLLHEQDILGVIEE